MKTKLLAATICALALTACDFEKRPDSAPDQGGAGVKQPASPGGAPMSPATPPGGGAGGGAGRSAPPAGGGSSGG